MGIKSAIPFRTSVLLSLVFLPYLFYLPATYPDRIPFIILFFSVVLLEIGYQKTRTELLNRLEVDLSILVVPSLILLLYYQPLIQIWSKFNAFFVHLPTIRARYFLPFSWLVILASNYFLLKKRNNRAYLINVFLGIFSLILLISSIMPHKTATITFARHLLPIERLHTKPVVLIILDEYASPSELARYTHDTMPMQFSKQLQATGWKVSTSSSSKNKATVNSLASLFNYNLALTDANIEAPTAIRLLRQSSLLADLEKKGIVCYNGGIFDVGKTQAYSKIYYYEKEEKQANFIKHLFSKSMFSLLYLLTPDEKQAIHNRSIVEQAARKITRLSSRKTFFYLHLLMPHPPLYYIGSKSYLPSPYQDKVSNYLDFWQFTNEHVYTHLILPLIQSQKFKIILTGDHGYRFYPEKINPYLTMTAYYGFPKGQTKQIKSVQDLGSLIYASY
ncbi:MAG: sulfatase-like hydrolase/transferase [Cytophagales bacterium]|nr:sulfatase-like hydrolase/transferase [Cytophagales bacterium]